MERCTICERDRLFLTSRVRPPYEGGGEPLRVVDLFCGCGGLSLGVAEAARAAGRALDIRLAVDSDADALAVYEANFPGARVSREPVERLIDGGLGDAATEDEQRLASETGRVDILVAGPPCQGHSDLNNHTRRSDGRNLLYLRVARAAEILRPSVVVIENVPAVRHATDDVVSKTRRALEAIEYTVEDRVISLVTLGVPQSRRRHVLLAYETEPRNVLSSLGPRCTVDPERDLAWAIRDLLDSTSAALMDRPSKISPANTERMDWLFEHDAYDLPNRLRPVCHQSEHSYVSMYGRLRWDRPTQTITTGFGSMGQGRYVHPGCRRTLTPHEAARIQMLPDFFDFSLAQTHGALAMLIGNAVPPTLATRLVSPFLVRRTLDDPMRIAEGRRLGQPVTAGA